MVGLNWGKTIAMSTVATAELTQRPAEPDSPPAEADVWTRIDRWAAAASDWFNPILIKETRQALKSRQFLVTFSAILVASLGWTIAGSLSMMPQIYSQPSAARMLIGYYVVLAIPMMLVVPLAAYRSLEVEIDDGTLELLSISALSSWQIVLGKLASAVLQMLLYLVVLLPCVAYAYTLRGVDLPAVALMVAIVVAAASTVTVFALALAPVSRGRGGRIATLLVVLGTLLLVEYLIGYTVVILINEGNPLPGIWTAYAVAAATLVCGSGSYLLLTTTAALLTPESENRSTPVRIAMLIFTLTALGMAAFAIEAGQPEDRQSQDFAAGGLLISLTVLAVVWTYGGSLLVAESDQLTPRVTRTLPATMAGRAVLTFLTPGPATGLVFAAVMALMLLGALWLGVDRVSQRFGLNARGADSAILWGQLYVSYLIIFLFAARWIVAAVRIRNNPRVEVGFAAMICVALMAALIPYSIGLHANDYRPYSYSAWQASNWFWTFGKVAQGSLNPDPMALRLIYTTAGMCFLAALVGAAPRSLPMRTVTPVEVERSRGRR